MRSQEIYESTTDPCDDPACTHGDLYFGRPLCSYPRRALLAIIRRMHRDAEEQVTRHRREREILSDLGARLT